MIQKSGPSLSSSPLEDTFLALFYFTVFISSSGGSQVANIHRRNFLIQRAPRNAQHIFYSRVILGAATGHAVLTLLQEVPPSRRKP